MLIRGKTFVVTGGRSGLGEATAAMLEREGATAVIAVPDDKWSERPLAVVVLREGAAATDGELRDFLAPSFAKFWLPDRFEYVDEIPKTAVGKFRKTALRERFASAAPVENA